jgi:DNA processing protein
MSELIIKQGDPDYPSCLLELSDPPKQLYCRGNISLLTCPAVAIVGTRDCTRYGNSVTVDLAKHCAENGICVVSGLADGIDTAAHTGAKQHTIAVLGNGLDVYYPASNRDLQDFIAQYGLLITEYENNFHGNLQTFPQRNRIIAALSSAVAVTEADIKSGTMHTVRFAQKLHRDIFAVPGQINSYASRGTNKLIKDKTAVMLTSSADLTDYFGKFPVKQLNTQTPAGFNTPKFRSVSMDEKTILDILKHDEVHFDELCGKSSFPIAALSALLTQMELSGLIEKLPMNLYTGKREKNII